MLDLAIIGSGPAALTAAIYAARAGLKVKVYERGQIGGALANIANIANFPGYTGSGEGLAQQMRDQALASGAEIEYGEVTGLDLKSAFEGSADARGASAPLARNDGPSGRGPEKALSFLVDSEPISARSLLVATGSEPRPLDTPTTTPISYCATCDAPFYKGKNVIVVGGGNSAVSESLHLVKLVKSLTLVTHSTIRAEQFLLNMLKSNPNVTILEHTEPTTELLNQADGVFVCIGKRPASSFLPREVVDKNGYIVTDTHYMTQVPGLFAAGDVRDNSIKQAITAAGEGAAAAIHICNYLQNH